MIFLEELEIENFKNIKRARLDKLKDLNIIIGPNNCGKTNILDLIYHKLGKIIDISNVAYLCKECSKTQSQNPREVHNLVLQLSLEEFYLKKKGKMSVSFTLNKEIFKEEIKEQEKILDKFTCNKITEKIILENKQNETYLRSRHFSIFIDNRIIDKLKKSIVYIPSGRIRTYKNEDIDKHLSKFTSSGRVTKITSLIEYIKKYADPSICEYIIGQGKIIQKFKNDELETSLREQGSGIKSLICFFIDLIENGNENKIFLIDEPEIGLNPFLRQVFLKFLLALSENNQIFIATQDSTFVNPVLWGEHRDKVSVYIYSLVDDTFKKVDLGQNKEDPSTFAGYLPHTTSLKDFHIYVEGTSDVYIFQVFLEKYLRKRYPDNWISIFNKVGIYHLNGDFWEHLLYTVPPKPYKCIIILDGDKAKKANDACKKYKDASSKTLSPDFYFCEDIDNIDLKNRDEHPIYCLKEKCIERYLFSDFKVLPKNYNKKIDGVIRANEMKDIPKEIEEVFNKIFTAL